MRRSGHQAQLLFANRDSETLPAASAPGGLDPRPRAYHHPQKAVTWGPVSLAFRNSISGGKMIQKWLSFPPKGIVVVSSGRSHWEAMEIVPAPQQQGSARALVGPATHS